MSAADCRKKRVLVKFFFGAVLSHQSAPGEPRECRRPACRATMSSALAFVLFRILAFEMCATYRFWVVGWVDSLTVEQEAHAGWGLALTLAEGVHELFQLGGTLDLEEDLIVVVGNLDV